MSRESGFVLFMILIAAGWVAFRYALSRLPVPKRPRRKRKPLQFRAIPNTYPSCGCQPGCTGLPEDGEPLTRADRDALDGIEQATTTSTATDPDYDRRPRP